MKGLKDASIEMKDASIEMKDVFILNERVFSLVGVWPLQPTYLKFGITAVYFILHLVMVYANLIEVVGNLALLIDNLMESTVLTTTFCMIFVVRFSKLLPQIVLSARRDFAEFKYKNIGETTLYCSYNRFSWRFSTIVTCWGFTTAFLLYLQPLMDILRAGPGAKNNSDLFVLPYHMKVFVDYSDFRKYLLIYLFQLPLPYVGALHISMTCLIVNIVLHTAGRMSILAYRIRNISPSSRVEFDESIAELVQFHLNIIRMGKAINGTFSFILFIGLGETSIRLALSMYILSTVDPSNLEVAGPFVLFVLIMFFILYSYCYVGEELIQACNDVQNAYFYCDWQALPNSCKKSLLICMICGQKPLNITAGGYYIFSLYGFTNLIKSCMAYVSLLQTIM